MRCRRRKKKRNPIPFKKMSMVGGNNWIPYPEIGNDGGSNPKLMVSAKLSSSAPNGENALRSRAERPSIISKHAAIKIKKTAFSQSSSKANLMPVRPEHKPMVVKIFGKSFGKERLPGCFSISIKLRTDKQIATIKSTRRQLLDSIGISNQPCPKFSIVKVMWVADAFGNAFMRVGKKKRNNESQLVPLSNSIPIQTEISAESPEREVHPVRKTQKKVQLVFCVSEKATNLHGIIR